MSQPQVYLWLPSITAIAGNQSVPNGGNLALNANTPGTPGAFSYINILSTSPDINIDVIRSISLMSQAGSDNSGVTFVIVGIGVSVDGDGNPTGIIGPISEDITGPGDGLTVSSVNIYTQINSIAVTVADSTNISVSLGPFGITPYVSIDTNRTFAAITAQLQFYSRDTITATVNVSLNKPESPDNNGQLIPFGLIDLTPDIFLPAFPIITDAIDNVLQTVIVPIAVIWATIKNTGSGDALYFTILQQGTNSR